MTIHYSRGLHTFDNTPAQRSAPDFDAFELAFLNDRAGEKGLAYVCAPFAKGAHSDQKKNPGEKHWRSKALALPREFLPFDIDQFAAPEDFEHLKSLLARYRGFAYTTASHTDEDPRARVVLAQSRATTRDEGIALANEVQRQFVEELEMVGAGAVTFDSAVYKAEQPLYTPLHSSQVFSFNGAPVDVDAVLADVPAQVASEPRQRGDAGDIPHSTAAHRASIAAEGDPVLQVLNDRGMVKGYISAGHYAVVCPCASDHTSDSGKTTTRYSLPNFGGVKYGKFHCMHEHCNGRDQAEFLRALGLDPRDVWRQQRGDTATGTPGAAKGFAVVPAAEFAAGPPPAWIVKGVLPEAEIAVIYGESGSGKTFFVLDLVAAVARGVDWRGLRVKQGRAVYVAAEGAGGFRKRLAAYAMREGVDLAALPLGVINDAPNFLTDDDQAMADAITQAGGASVIVIDTLAQTTPGANENAGEDMGKVIAHCRRLARATGALVVLVHHSGKDATKGARGWSGVKAAADAEIEITRNVRGARPGDFRAARVTKQKDGEDGAVFGFGLATVQVGEDEDGAPVESCVIEHQDALPVSGQRGPKGTREQMVLKVAHDLAEICDGRASVAAVVDQAVSAMPAVPGKRDRRAETVARALESLAAGGLVSVVDGVVFVPHATPAPHVARVA